MPGTPSLNTNTSSSASSKSTAAFDDSGFVVNFGSGTAGATTAATTPAPGWLYPALAVGAVLWLTRKR